MALDGLVVSALAHELSSLLEYNRIEKIYQPEADEIIIHIRSQGKNLKLLLSSSSNYPRVHFTNVNKENPSTPPNFCMLLRKYIQGGKIVDILQPDFERIIKFKIETLDELNMLKHRELIIEMMGKHSNIILIDCEDNKILDSIKRISLDISRYRQILPGLKYNMPPSQNKFNPLSVTSAETFRENLTGSLQIPVIKALYATFTGISPLIAREVCYLANVDGDHLLVHLSEEEHQKLFMSFQSLLHVVDNNNFVPIIYFDTTNSKYIDFTVMDLHHLSELEKQEKSSISNMLESFYANRDNRERIKQKSYDLRKNINTKLDRLYNKMQNLHHDLKKAEKADLYRLKGELLTTNLHQIEKGQEAIELINYYDENYTPLLIELDKKLTPSKNAQNYYKKYNKAKNALLEVAKQLEKTKTEIDYLEQIIVNIDQSTYLSDLEEIHNELMETGYYKKRLGKKKVTVFKKSGYLKYKSFEGFEILVGKNNKQNDEITLKIADKEDLWFHVKDRPGSHVVLRLSDSDYTDRSILEAASLAAYYSKAKNATKVAVDYTQRKNVRKPKGAKPGMVIYDNYSTILVDGDENAIQNIHQIE
ncbi:Predicted component of the ribosome quality control (RQC) complex, YloA/Tae2 family, contains fibronectin-binding (FbpA) and DUF814 domains [Natronincola peptidivorans]|uniref:Rqc2 homolog RqcH n=1 Tax=Natronincola peptidivorans TaxID=426128 RepID=A0A1H9YBI9_9FIRM|nr:NFACT RNA binding domain-containing protein [Natronincola peptidivorans]SES65854.1 Predicted component of the ribosome quality control (RQC) complex, YloA/Tae2 family, contains fibronectin-binding (FbpA) and DUF814 domains [Natronincola peptidivorans]